MKEICFIKKFSFVKLILVLFPIICGYVLYPLKLEFNYIYLSIATIFLSFSIGIHTLSQYPNRLREVFILNFFLTNIGVLIKVKSEYNIYSLCFTFIIPILVTFVYIVALKFKNIDINK